MCLTTGRLKPSIAKQDIYVVKQLNRSGDKYVTPHTGTVVELNEDIEAKGSSEISTESRSEITGGYIHAYPINRGKTDYRGFLAYIPAGTEYFIDDNMETICAKKLHITDERIESGDKPDKLFSEENFKATYEPFIETLLDSETKQGYYLLSDHTYVSPTDLTREQKSKAIAFVADANDHGKAIIALTEKSYPWKKSSHTQEETFRRYTDYDTAIADFDGEGNTKNATESDEFKKNPSDFPAFKYVNEFTTDGTKKGDWYIMSPGQWKKLLLRKFGLYNASVQLTGVGETLRGWYWASAEGSQGSAWGCYTRSATVRYFDKWGSLQVRPSLALAAA